MKVIRGWITVAVLVVAVLSAAIAPAATTIVTRSGKGQALTYAEMDANFTNLKATADAAQPETGAWNDTKSPRSLGASGYQKFPSGLIIQWGSSTIPSSSGYLDIVFPISFTNTNFVFTTSSKDSSLANQPNSAHIPIAVNQVRVYAGGSVSNLTVDWMAIGY